MTETRSSLSTPPQFAFVILADLDHNWLGKPSQILSVLKGATCLEFLLGQVHSFGFEVVLSIRDPEKKAQLPESLNSRNDLQVLYTKETSESKRIKEAVESIQARNYIRISADNPILGKEVLGEILDSYQEGTYYFTFGFPTGIQIEVLSQRILESCLETKSKKRIREILKHELAQLVPSRSIQPGDRKLLRPETRWTTGVSRDYQQLKTLLELELPGDRLSDYMDAWIHKDLDILNPPASINIEPTNKCNLNCVMCPRDDMVRPLGNMEMETFYKTIDDAVQLGVQNIILHGYGEPFISGEIFEMVRHIRENTSLHVRINTNGLYLTERRIRKILECPPHHLNVSIDGATAETYEKIRINGKYSKLEQCIENFLRIRKEEFSESDVRFSLQFIRMEETEHEVELFQERWEGLVDEIAIPPVHNWAGTYQARGLRKKEEVLRIPCRELWRTIVVSYDGTSTICCAVINDDPDMGNVKEKSLEEIWHSDAYKKLRNIHLNGNFDELSLCKDCDLWKSIG